LNYSAYVNGFAYTACLNFAKSPAPEPRRDRPTRIAIGTLLVIASQQEPKTVTALLSIVVTASIISKTPFLLNFYNSGFTANYFVLR